MSKCQWCGRVECRPQDDICDACCDAEMARLSERCMDRVTLEAVLDDEASHVVNEGMVQECGREYGVQEHGAEGPTPGLQCGDPMCVADGACYCGLEDEAVECVAEARADMAIEVLFARMRARLKQVDRLTRLIESTRAALKGGVS